MRQILLLWLACTSVACGVFAYRAMCNRAELAELRVQSEKVGQAALTERQDAERKLADVDQQLDSARKKVAAAEALFARRSADLPSATSNKPAALRKQIEQDPSYQPFRRRDMRRDIFRFYGHVLPKTTLPPEKLERLKQLLEDRNYGLKDALEITGNSETERMTTLGVHAVMQAQVTVDAEIFELVGETLYHDIKYASFYRELDLEVTDFENSLADHGLSPLAPAQRDALKAAYQAAHYPRIPGEEKNPILSGQHGPEADLKVEQLVKGVLSPEQFAGLSAHHRVKRVLSEMYSRVDDEMIKRLAPAKLADSERTESAE